MWKYDIVKRTSSLGDENTSMTIEELDLKGADDWELVQVVPLMDRGLCCGTQYIFKKAADTR